MINDANIIPIDRVPAYTRAIKIGNRVFPLAVYTDTSGGTSFYKCATVDTSAKTWSGYKAVLTDGVYSFAETVTEGLSYSAITPEVGKIYTADALAEIKSLYDGSDPTMVFYAPLSESADSAETGQILTENGTIQYSDGWVTIAPNSYISVSDECNFGTQWSFSTNFKFSGGGVAWLFSSNVGNPDTNMRLVLLDSGAVETTVIGGSDGRMASNKTYADGKPHCIVWTGDSGTTKLYVDGEQVGSASYYGTQSIGVVIGGIYRGSASAQQRGVRFYNRVLSEAEITELANEFSGDNPDSGDKSYELTVSGLSGSHEDANGDYWKIDPPSNMWSGYNTTDYGVYTNGTYYLVYCNNYWTGWCMVTDITIDPAPMEGSDALIALGPGGDSPAVTWGMFGATVAEYAG